MTSACLAAVDADGVAAIPKNGFGMDEKDQASYNRLRDRRRSYLSAQMFILRLEEINCVDHV